MNSIKLFELDVAGTDLFQDEESFLHELTNEYELHFVRGGQQDIPIQSFISPGFLPPGVSPVTFQCRLDISVSAVFCDAPGISVNSIRFPP